MSKQKTILSAFIIILLTVSVFTIIVPNYVSATDIEQVVDSYGVENHGGNFHPMRETHPVVTALLDSAMSQSFTNNLAGSTTLTKVGYYIERVGSPNAFFKVSITGITGAYSSGAYPNATIYATSDEEQVSGWSASWTLHNFTFSTPFVMLEGQQYCLMLYSTSATTLTSTNYINVALDDSAPTASGVDAYYRNDGWHPHPYPAPYTGQDWDEIYYVYGVSTPYTPPSTPQIVDSYHGVVTTPDIFTLQDSYATGNMSDFLPIVRVHPSAEVTKSSAISQAFTASSAGILTTISLYVNKSALPTGNLQALLYGITGAYGTNSSPNATLYASSAVKDSSTLTTVMTLVNWTFTDSYTLVNGAQYVLVLEATSATFDDTNFVNVGVDVTASAHGGNLGYYRNGAWLTLTSDCIFYVYTGVSGATGSTENNVASLVTVDPSITVGQSSAISQSLITYNATSTDFYPYVASFMLNKTGSPNALLQAQLYGYSGAYGTTSYPNATVYATSNNVSSTLLSGTMQWVNFTFVSTHQLVNSSVYTLVLKVVGGTVDVANYVSISVDTIYLLHSGNFAYYRNSGWTAQAWDTVFIFYASPSTPEATPTPTPIPTPAPSATPIPIIPVGLTILYLRSDINAYNGTFSGYYLDATNTNSPLESSTALASANIQYGYRVWLLKIGGSMTELTSGTPEATISRVVTGSGYQCSYWTPSATSLVLGYDRIVVLVYKSTDSGATWSGLLTFISRPLMSKQLVSSPWNFTCFTSLSASNVTKFSYGDTYSVDSRIEGIYLTEPLPQEIALWKGSTGDFIGMALYPFVYLTGNLIYSLGFLGIGGIFYLKNKKLEIILVIAIIFLCVQGVATLIPGDIWKLIWLIVGTIIGVVIYKLFR